MSDAHLITRREILAGTAGCLAGLIASALGISKAEAAALPVRFHDGDSGAGEIRYPIPPGDSVSVDQRTQVIVVRYQSRVYAMSLVCPHENASVRWLPKEGHFECTKHHSRYTPEGTFITGRATRNLDRFPVHRENDQIVVTTDGVFRSDQNASGWGSAMVQL
jgi:nitrite reductase/ring-hydroxylating ferredoxin subunit